MAREALGCVNELCLNVLSLDLANDVCDGNITVVLKTTLITSGYPASEMPLGNGAAIEYVVGTAPGVDGPVEKDLPEPDGDQR